MICSPCISLIRYPAMKTVWKKKVRHDGAEIVILPQATSPFL